MKKVLLTLGVAAFAASVFAQGTITFTTFSTPNGVNAKVFNTDGVTPLSGANYMAQLYTASGTGAAESSLAGALPISTFRTGGAVGYVALTTVTCANVPKDFAGGATVQVRAWDNSSGLYSTWDQAKTAWDANLIAVGKSPLLNITAKIGGDLTSPPYLTGLQGFSLAYNVPEPSTMALAGLGAAALLIFRRRK